ncbi:MAG: 3-isopropylmalate dehydratase large subunit [Alphaproteobacteria bacterium]|nr:3-isopropylmalate dehydratase large subunit [Alphaproteobacteria bacterium]
MSSPSPARGPGPAASSAEAPAPRTLFDKIWDAHVIADLGDGAHLLHIDRHLVHEVTSKHAFESLRRRGLRVRNPELTFAMVDHIVATDPGRTDRTNPTGWPFIEAWRRNCRDFGVTHFDLDDERQGIVHVVAPELAITLPGCTLVCGDSHTASNGAVGALAWGIGASEVEHVLATQTVALRRPRRMRLVFDGRPAPGVTAKDLILHAIGRLGTAAGRGHVVEYAGEAIAAMAMDGRLTICNMSIEMGARAGLIAPDARTLEHLAGRDFAPRGPVWDRAVEAWRELHSDPDAVFDREERFDCAAIAPQVTWGNSPQDVVAIDEPVPDPARVADLARRNAIERALRYMALAPGRPLTGTRIDYAFIGSCTNGRYSDLEAAARVARGRRVAPHVRALVVPGSMRVKRAAESAGLDRIFIEAGFEWRNAGCSMCVTANGEVVPPGQRCIATSNRNFENRQGPGSRTHLASPESVAAAAVSGEIVDVRRMMG